MKKHMFSFILCLTIVSCEPAYRLYIHNNTSQTIYARFDKPVESEFDKNAPIYDSILKKKADVNLSVYKIEPNGYFEFFSCLGTIPSQAELPFDSIEITVVKDLSRFRTKGEILRNLHKSIKRKYLLEIGNVH